MISSKTFFLFFKCPRVTVIRCQDFEVFVFCPWMFRFRGMFENPMSSSILRRYSDNDDFSLALFLCSGRPPKHKPPLSKGSSMAFIQRQTYRDCHTHKKTHTQTDTDQDNTDRQPRRDRHKHSKGQFSGYMVKC